VAAAAVILLLSRVAGGKEELENLLTGDILNVTVSDVMKRAATFVALGVFYGAFHRRFALISENFKEALASGMYVRLWDFLFYAAFSIVVVSFVRIAGVLLTFAYLIVPAVCAVMLARTWLRRLVVGWSLAAIASVAGLWASYKFDLPTGAAIVVACGILLAIVSMLATVRARSGRRAVA
jgi:zinc/manganese transport system permease protein